jgi:hypothetical protein
MAFEAGNAILNDFRNAGLHHIGGGPGIIGAHGDYRRVYIGIFPQGQALKRQYAERNQ